MLYSAFGTHAIERAARKLGAVDVLDGMIDPERLVATVRKARHDQAEATVALVEVPAGFADERWALIVSPVVLHSRDIPTVQAWARFCGNSVATIKKICETCDTKASLSLDLARGFRIVRKHAGRSCDWYNELDIKEPETMKTFLAWAGLDERELVPSIDTYMQRQRLIGSPRLVAALLKVFNAPV